MTTTQDRQRQSARWREVERKRALARDIAAARPFVAPPCARCKAPLMDADGNPRWDVIGRLTFVCLGGCPRRSVRRKAAAC